MSNPDDLELVAARSSGAWSQIQRNVAAHRDEDAPRALRHRRDGGEVPGAEVDEPAHATLAPVQVEHEAEDHRPEEPLEDRLERAEEAMD